MKIKIEYNTGPEEIEIPASWNELTWRQYVAFLRSKQSPSEHFAGASNVTIDYVMQFVLMDPAGEEGGTEKDVGECEWSMLEAVKMGFVQDCSPMTAAIEAVQVYEELDIADDAVCKHTGLVIDILEKVIKFIKDFDELMAYNQDEKEVLASYDEETKAHLFSDLGFFVTLDTLADGDILKYDDILKQPATKVYNKLLLDLRKRKFSDNYKRILDDISRTNR